MKRLNGWQRLFLVICTFIAAGAWRDGTREYPTQNSDDLFWSRSAAMQLPEVARYKEDQFCVEIKAQPVAGGTPCGSVPKPLAERIAAYDKIIDGGKDGTAKSLFGRQVAVIGNHLVAWLGTCAALYAAGWIVAWVVRGFRGTPREKA